MHKLQDNFKVTPWEVEGKVDYNRLVEFFGLKLIDEKIKEKLREFTKDLHVLIRRNHFFAHRDFDILLEELEKGNNFFLYTGRGPSGPMHIGHLIPFLITKWLQDKFNANVYIQLTDDEKFLEPKRKLKLEETQKWAYENALDIAAVGFDENKTFIFKNTEYIKNFYQLALKIAKKINFSTVKAVFGFKGETNIGLIFFPALEIAPTFFEDNYCLIPASVDQDPFWRVQRDIAEKLNKKKAFQIHSKFLPPLTGIEGKMSTSKPETTIFLHDDEEIVRNKIFKYAFSGGQPTVELHRKLGGNPDVDICFQYLYFLFEEDDKKIEEIREEYRNGNLLTGELKEYTAKKINEFLNEFRKRREKIKIEKFFYKGKLAQEMWNKIYK